VVWLSNELRITNPHLMENSITMKMAIDDDRLVARNLIARTSYISGREYHVA
jgi:hypothetical protein